MPPPPARAAAFPRPEAGRPAAGAGSAAAAYAAFRHRSRFSSLDGLRFFCIFAVLWHHSPVYGAMADPPALLTRGFLGVDFFFVLSGFLITTLLLREEDRDGSFSLRGFYRRRLLRIVPVYFFLVTALSAYYLLVKGAWHYAPLVPFYYLFLANFLPQAIPLLYPTWSLSVEEQYYLIWPLLLLLMPRRAVLPVLGGLVALNVLGVMGLLGVDRGPDIGLLHIALPNATYAPILMGSALAVALDGPRGFALLYRLLGHRLAPIWTLAVLLVIVALGPPDLRGLPDLAIHLAMSACLASLVLRDDHVLRPLLTWRPVARVGEVSYGIYLYHLVGLHFGMSLAARLPGAMAANPWAVLVIYIAVSIAIAELSYRTLEAYFRRFRHRPARRVPAD